MSDQANRPDDKVIVYFWSSVEMKSGRMPTPELDHALVDHRVVDIVTAPISGAAGVSASVVGLSVTFLLQRKDVDRLSPYVGYVSRS